MICKNCNAEIDNSSVFCINCGTPIEIEPEKPQPKPVYQQPAYPQPQYQQPAYQPRPQPQPQYQQPQYQPRPQYQPQPQPQFQPQPQPQYQQPVYDEYDDDDNNAPITSVGQYVGWFFLMCIPGVSIILAIVFACIRNHRNKNRANFFAAIWAFFGIWLAIAAVCALVWLVIMLIMTM